MSLKYIVEICVGIDVAIFGIAYPIIITEINKIGDKYNSNYLSELFRLEWISKEIRFWSIKTIICNKYYLIFIGMSLRKVE